MDRSIFAVPWLLFVECFFFRPGGLYSSSFNQNNNHMHGEWLSFSRWGNRDQKMQELASGWSCKQQLGFRPRLTAEPVVPCLLQQWVQKQSNWRQSRMSSGDIWIERWIMAHWNDGILYSSYNKNPVLCVVTWLYFENKILMGKKANCRMTCHICKLNITTDTMYCLWTWLCSKKIKLWLDTNQFPYSFICREREAGGGREGGRKGRDAEGLNFICYVFLLFLHDRCIWPNGNASSFQERVDKGFNI